MERFLSRVSIAMAAAVAAIIFVATAAAFLCAALYLALISMSAAPPLAALIVGLASLVLAGLIILVARAMLRWRRADRTSGEAGSAVPGLAGNVNDLAARFGALAAQELTSQAQAHPYRSLVAALLAGLAVGVSPELRDLVKKALKN